LRTALSAASHLLTTTWSVFRLPLSYLWARLSLVDKDAPPFSQASFFEDIVLRCVKYAFANVDYRVGRVFFSKDVAAKFYRYRLASRGWLSSPTPIEEKKEVSWSIAMPRAPECLLKGMPRSGRVPGRLDPTGG